MPPCKGNPSSDYNETLTWTNCFGTLTYRDGTKYFGEWKDGYKHGQGTHYYLADNKHKGDKNVGEYKDNKKHGQGTYTFADGERPSAQRP